MTNLKAFLAMLSNSEGTDRAADPYRVTFGFEHTIQNLADHPALTGEWTGYKWAGGFSTAAGRYQMIRATWANLKAELGLPDFTAPSQDAAATRLIERAGALDLVNAGKLDQAIPMCSHLWASLPGSTSGQPQKSMAELVKFYTDAGGAYA